VLPIVASSIRNRLYRNPAEASRRSSIPNGTRPILAGRLGPFDDVNGAQTPADAALAASSASSAEGAPQAAAALGTEIIAAELFSGTSRVTLLAGQRLPVCDRGFAEAPYSGDAPSRVVQAVRAPPR